MRDVTEKNKVINRLIKDEIERLEKKLNENTESLHGEELGLPSKREKLERSERLIEDYKSNIDSLKEQIDLLK